METGLVWLHGIFDVLYPLSYVSIPLTFIYWIRKWQKTEQAEEVLWQNQECLNLVLQAADMGQWEWTIQTGKIYWSASLERMFGMTPGTFDGRYETIVGMIHSEDREWVTQAIYRAVYERDDYQVEFRFVKPDGTIRWALSRGRVFYDPMGNPIRMIGVDLDITERKQAEAALQQLNQELEARVEQRTAALQESEECWQLALRGSNDGIWDWSLKTNQIFLSARWKEMRGFAEDESNDFVCKKWLNQIHLDDRDRVLTALNNHLAGKTPLFQEEYRVQRKDGSYMWILDRGQALRDEAGNVIRMAGSESDISVRKQIEQSLRKSEARYRAIVEDQTELIARFLPDTTLVFVNEAYCRYFGLQREEIIGKSYQPVIFEEDWETVTQLVQSMSAENPSVTIENRVVVNGEIRWTQWNNRMLFDEQGQFVELQSVGRDITELKQIEATLKQYERIVSTATDGIALVDRNYMYLVVNQAYLARLNQPHSEVVGHSMRDIRGHEFFDSFIKPRLDRCLAGETVQYENWFHYPHLLPQFLSVTCVPYLDTNQAIVGVVVSLRDITNLHRTEEALRISEERLKLALEGSGDGLWDWNIVTGEVYFNANWLEMLGCAENELPHHHSTWEKLVHPDDKLWVMEVLNAHLKDSSAPYAFDYRVRTKFGEWKWIANYGKVVARDEHGSPLRMVGTHKDISDRKQTEEQLRSLSERLTLAIKSGGFGIWEYDFVQDKQIWDDRVYELYGITPDNFVNTFDTWFNCLHPDDRDEVLQTLQQVVHENKEYDTEFRIIRPSGEIRFLKTCGILQRDKRGNPVHIIGVNFDITTRKLAEESLRESERRFATLAEASPVAIFRFDTSGNCVYVNNRWSEMTGRPAEEGLGMGWIQTLHPEDIDRTLLKWSQWTQVLNTERLFQNEARILCPDGCILWIYCQMLPETNPDGIISGYVGVLADISDRKHSEEQLRNLSDRLALALQSGAIGIWEWDVIHDVLIWDDRMYELYGLQLSHLVETLDEVWTRAVHPDDLAQVKATLRQSLQGEKEFDTEFRIVHPDGNIRFIKASALVQRNNSGEPQRMVGINYDITERKQAEEALDKYAHEVEDLYNNAPCGYHSLDSEGRMINVNETELKWLGYTREEMIGKPFTDFITQAGHSVFEQNYPRFKERGWVKDLEYNMVCKDGTIFPVLLNATAVKSEDGTYLYNRATLFDLRDRKRAEQELQELNTAMQNAVEGISRLDADGRYTSVNRAYANMCGYEPEELIGQLWQQTVYSEDVPDMLATYQQMLQTGKVNAETRGVRKDGSCFYKQVTMISIHDEQGNVTGNHCFMKDISDRKYAEVQLRQTNEQLARATRLRDEFLANMSHELRTPLNAILGMSEGLQEGVFGSINERQVKAIATIERSGRHLLELINDILDLSKIESGKLELQISNVPVRSLCDASLSFIRQMALKKNIHLITRIPDNVGSIQADNRRLRQVLINLLNNAVKFTPEGGSVTLEVRIEEVQEPRSREAKEAAEVNFSLSSPSLLSPSSPSSSHICFCVTDTGIGIAPDDVGKLFQAFVQIDSSLNRQYSGTGLGLALVQRIATLHEGTVSVESEVGRGSCFTVRIPYDSTGEVTRMSVAAPLPTAPFPLDKAPVLIIEDSISAADQIARYLSENGMQSIIYPHGKGACEEVLRVQPSLVILDIQLPNLSGWDVLTQLKTHPQTRDIPVLIVSVVDERSRGLAMGASEYLVKPITRSELQASLRKLQGSIMTETTTLIVVPESAPEPPLILLAEDNLANIDTISGYLESRGYRLILARDGRQAIELTKSQRPNLIVMDIQMPGMDGLEAMRHIRAEEQIHIPIIALTALAMPSDQERCLKVGANKYLTKPIKLKQLVGTIQQLLSQSKGNLQ